MPTYTELGVFSVMWSEHCSYKSSRVHLRGCRPKGRASSRGPGENAGVVDIGDGQAAVFKMESHNHPSFIEPYQGAATGVGGILRDVFTMGARPIADLNSLRFGRPDHPRTPELLARRGRRHRRLRQLRSACRPSAARSQFDASYDGNILVNAFTCGVARTDRIFYGRAPRASATRCSTSAPRPAATASTARPWPRPSSGRGHRGEAPDGAGRRSLHGEAPPRGVPRALGSRLARGHPGHGRRRAHLVVGRDGGARGQRHRARSRPAAAARGRR